MNRRDSERVKSWQRVITAISAVPLLTGLIGLPISSLLTAIWTDHSGVAFHGLTMPRVN